MKPREISVSMKPSFPIGKQDKKPTHIPVVSSLLEYK
jgi:hypothetical protein